MLGGGHKIRAGNAEYPEVFQYDVSHRSASSRMAIVLRWFFIDGQSAASVIKCHSTIKPHGWCRNDADRIYSWQHGFAHHDQHRLDCGPTSL